MKKDIKNYIRLPYKMEIVRDVSNNTFVVRYPTLPGCLSAGRTIEEAVANAEEAKREWLEAAIEDLQEIPQISVTRDDLTDIPLKNRSD